MIFINCDSGRGNDIKYSCDDIIKLKLILIEQLNSNLDILLNNYDYDFGKKKVEELIGLLALVDECIDNTVLLSLIEDLG